MSTLKGKHQSKEHIEKRMIKIRGTHRKPHSVEWKENMKRIMLNKMSNGTHPNYKGGKSRFPKCLVCGKQLSYKNAKHCRQHMGLKGNKNPNYKGRGDLRELYSQIRNSQEYKIWRLEIYKRDRWTCRICNVHCSNKTIVAHHLKLFSEYPELRFSLDNGITLCRTCHCKIHSPQRFHKINNKTIKEGDLNS